MQKSGIIKKIKTTALIGPFFAAMLVAYTAHAVDSTVCPLCYVYKGGSCVKRSDYAECMMQNVDCGDGATWNAEKKECVCTSLSMGCRGFWQFWGWAPGGCDCLKTNCESGKYASDIDVCEDCPVPDFALSGSCGVHSSADYADDAIVMGGGNGCYIPKGCTGKDETGNFELVADCKYTTGSGLPGIL